MRITVELGLDAEHKFTALKLRWDANLGAYVTGRSGWPVGNIGGTAGVYHIPTMSAEVVRHPDQHRADRRLSRRRAAGGDLHHRAHDRRRRARARHQPVRAAPDQPDPARGDAVQDRADLHLRLRRVRRQHAEGRGAGRTRRLRGTARGGRGARQAARHRPVQLHRGRRRSVPAPGEGPGDAAPGRGWHADPALRLDVGGAGAGDGVLPARRRTLRRAARQVRYEAGDTDLLSGRQGQRRVGRAVHRRIGGQRSRWTR